MDWGNLRTIAGEQSVSYTITSGTGRFRQQEERIEEATSSELLFSAVRPPHSGTCTLRNPSSIFRLCISKCRAPSRWRLVNRQNRSGCVTHVAGVGERYRKRPDVRQRVIYRWKDRLEREAPAPLSHYATPILTPSVAFWSQLLILNYF
jgi:hypothetical protein